MEILAPAGNTDMLRAAVFSGADCVYLGAKGFNARGGAENFDEEGITAAVAFCKARNCGVYAAVNTLVLPGREADFLRLATAFARAGCDAFIVQDLGAAGLLRRHLPEVPLHASTQMSVHSAAGVQTLARLGFARVILAREMREGEIAKTAEAAAKCGVEVEVFVHGALCVSMSGQCYMSAFWGGRSANRGACASPCRLPLTAGATFATEAYHLSLKDLSILYALPRLEQLGVASAKIEGRLRGPEYCALAVHSAKQALAGEPFDVDLLQRVFSRGGLTDGWFTGKDCGMFSEKPPGEAKAEKKAKAAARELYRREAPRVPVHMALTLFNEDADTVKTATVGESAPANATGILTVTDGTNRVEQCLFAPLAPMAADAAANTAALRAALEKTGVTPFFASASEADIAVEANGMQAPPAAVSALRRAALEELLQVRDAAVGREIGDVSIAVSPTRFEPKTETNFPRPSAAKRHDTALSGTGLKSTAQTSALHPSAARRAILTSRAPALRARFAGVAQTPPSAADACREFIFPLAEAANVPEHLRERTWLSLPRAVFPFAEDAIKTAVEQAHSMGFHGFEAQNLAHFPLCGSARFSGGFGLNIANAEAAKTAAALGCEAATLSFELSFRQMQALADAAKTAGAPKLDAICYGHLPVMLTRACPVKNVATCAKCGRTATLTDRKGERSALTCDGVTREIYNPVPLWTADILDEFPTDTVTLFFTRETRDEAADVIDAYRQGKKASGAFTRGLYQKGTGG